MRIRLLVTASMGTLLLMACAPTSPAAPTAPPAAPTPAPVKVKMGDPVFNPMAPVYIALDRGYFADEGLEVELVTTSAQADLASQVGLGQLQFGMSGPDPA